MATLALPALFALAMVGFVALRKAGMARVLKPHQRSIGLGVAVTVVVSLLTVAGKVEDAGAGPSVNHAVFVLVPQMACFAASLALRKENEPVVAFWSVVWGYAMLAAQTFMCGYLSLAAGLVGVTIGVLLKGRMGYLIVIWALLCLATTASCLASDEEDGPRTAVAWAFVAAETASLLLVKLAHPALDADLPVAAAEAAADEEKGWQW